MHLGSNGVLCIGAVAGCQALGQEQSAALVLWCRGASGYACGLWQGAVLEGVGRCKLPCSGAVAECHALQ